MNDNPQGQQVDPNRIFEIKLPAGIWGQLLAMLGKQSWEQADPIIREINRQITEALNAPPGAPH